MTWATDTVLIVGRTAVNGTSDLAEFNPLQNTFWIFFRTYGPSPKIVDQTRKPPPR